MLTWLDWYIAGARESFRERFGYDPGSDMAAMRTMALATLSLPDAARVLRRIVEEGSLDDRLLAVRQFLYGVILPFLLDEQTLQEANTEQLQRQVLEQYGGRYRYDPSAFAKAAGLRPSEDLVAALLGATLSEEVRRDGYAALLERTWYVDVPHHALPVRDMLQVRAIFTQPAPAVPVDDDTPPRPPLIVAIITDRGANRYAGIYAWLRGKTSGGPEFAVGAGLLDEDETAQARLRETIEHLVLALLAYRLHASNLVCEPLPRRAPDAVERAPTRKAAKRLRNKTTLFSIHDLRPPADRFGKPKEHDVPARGGWRLTHVVQVRGHFRWQPHGPARALRKLIWIAPHERGQGRLKPDMDML